VALIECPECERQVSEKAEACPGCGHPVGVDPDTQICGWCAHENPFGAETCASCKTRMGKYRPQKQATGSFLSQAIGIVMMAVGGFLAILGAAGCVDVYNMHREASPAASSSAVFVTLFLLFPGLLLMGLGRLVYKR